MNDRKKKALAYIINSLITDENTLEEFREISELILKITEEKKNEKTYAVADDFLKNFADQGEFASFDRDMTLLNAISPYLSNEGNARLTGALKAARTVKFLSSFK